MARGGRIRAALAAYANIFNAILFGDFDEIQTTDDKRRRMKKQVTDVETQSHESLHRPSSIVRGLICFEEIER
jgi:hypothetical protein